MQALKVPLGWGFAVLAMLGMVLIWYEGDQTGKMDYTFFGLLVATLHFSAAIAAFGESSFAPLSRTIGTFFLILNIEASVCMLPPIYGGTSAFGNQIGGDGDRWRTSYVGGVFVLIAVFAGFLVSYTNVLSGPAPNIGGRIASARGGGFLLAIVTCILGSAIAWSYKYVCATGLNSRPQAIPDANATLVIFLFVFLSSLLYGDAESESLSIFLACVGLLYYTIIFDESIQWPTDDKWEDKWRAQGSLVWGGFLALLLGTFVDKVLKNKAAKSIGEAIASKQFVLDFVAFGIGLAGAVSVYVRSDTVGFSILQKRQVNYIASYAIVIPSLALIGNLLGSKTAVSIAVFFAPIVLERFDTGSTKSTQGYYRGGLQLCQGATLLTVFANAIPASVLEGGVTKLLADKKNAVATAFLVIWLLIAQLLVPVNYSRYIVYALVSFSGLALGDKDFARIAFFFLGFWGVAGQFPLTNTWVGTTNAYVNCIIYVAATAYALVFANRASCSCAPCKCGDACSCSAGAAPSLSSGTDAAAPAAAPAPEVSNEPAAAA